MIYTYIKNTVTCLCSTVDIGKQHIYNSFSDIYMNMPQHNTISYETYYNNQMQSLQQSFKKKEWG